MLDPELGLLIRQYETPEHVRPRDGGVNGVISKNSQKPNMSLRIIAGEYRRRQLQTPPTRDTRPYTDRVRQIVFDRIESRVADARVADVFAGVGTMGLEALSRGARSCVFFEGDARIYASLSANVEAIAASEDTLCWKTNIHRTSFRPKGRAECLPYSVIFFDPPYAQCPLLAPREVLGKCLVRLAREDVSAEEAIIVLRTPGHFLFSECEAWNITDHWRISTMNLWILNKAVSPTPTDTEAPINTQDD